MATQRKKGKKATKKVQTLATGSLNERRAKAVKGGSLPRLKWETPVSYKQS